jgi:hypothetical protein
VPSIAVIEIIKQPAAVGCFRIALHYFFRKILMSLSSLFRTLLVAYACGASGSFMAESEALTQ